MIQKSILTAAAMLLAYHLAYPVLPKKFYRINGQQRQNYDRAQRYVFGPRKEGHLIVGSSMSLELSPAILGPDWRKLTFPGCSVLTAFEIMRRSAKQPAVLLVETNQCAWDANQDILDDLFNPVMAPPRRRSPIFLEEGRPSNFVAGIAEACVRDSCQLGSALLAKSGGAPKPKAEAVLSPELFNRVLALHREDMSDAGPRELLEKRVRQLGEDVDELRRTGCICILFEMPIDSTLENLKLPTAVRNAMQARFPRDRYDWLTFDRSRSYQTRDGTHLARDEADRLSESVVRQVGEIVRNSGTKL